MQSLCGFTWPGIEYGEPPCYKHSFFEVLMEICSFCALLKEEGWKN